MWTFTSLEVACCVWEHVQVCSAMFPRAPGHVALLASLPATCDDSRFPGLWKSRADPEYVPTLQPR